MKFHYRSGFEPVVLNQTIFPTPRLVASKINETTRLSNLPKINHYSWFKHGSEDPNLSPVLDVKMQHLYWEEIKLIIL